MKTDNVPDKNYTKTLSESVYELIKTAIFHNELKAGQRIYEKDVAKTYNVSTTPVREAFLRLKAEGYINIDAYRRAAVKTVSIQELEDIFDVLASLDVWAISQVVDHIDAEGIREIEKLIRQMEQVCKPFRIDDYLDLDRAIHHKIWDFLPNKVLKKILHSIHGQLLRYNYARYLVFQDQALMQSSLEAYKKIAKALAEKDKAKLQNLIQFHWSFLVQQRHMKKKYWHAFKGNDTLTKDEE
jgi:DNA-binding GntR family transcriptional regulator